MKKKEFSRLALLGMTSGLMAFGQTGLDASIDVQNLLAKPACKSKGGCGGLTASRDLPEDSLADEEDSVDEQDSHDADEADEEKEGDEDQSIKDKKMESTQKKL